MISLVLAESSLELVPAEIQSHPSVTRHAKRLGKTPSEILLDNSWHFAAMRGLDGQIKRGRPDLVHFSILAAITTPLYRTDQMRLYIHTINNKVIRFGSGVRMPKSYHRFEGIMERLYRDGQVASGNHVLLELENHSLQELLKEVDPAATIGLSTQGMPSTYEGIAAKIPDGACIVIGGFQKGHFSDSTRQLVDPVYSVGTMPLESHVVVARMLYEYEKTIFI